MKNSVSLKVRSKDPPVRLTGAGTARNGNEL
jgi:hypothetical protein